MNLRVKTTTTTPAFRRRRAQTNRNGYLVNSNPHSAVTFSQCCCEFATAHFCPPAAHLAGLITKTGGNPGFFGLTRRRGRSVAKKHSPSVKTWKGGSYSLKKERQSRRTERIRSPIQGASRFPPGRTLWLPPTARGRLQLCHSNRSRWRLRKPWTKKGTAETVPFITMADSSGRSLPARRNGGKRFLRLRTRAGCPRRPNSRRCWRRNHRCRRRSRCSRPTR